MKKLQQVIDDLKKIKNVEEDDLENEIISTWEDFEYDGETDIIVSSSNQMNCFVANEGVLHSTYINHKDAPIITISLTKNEDDSFNIEDAW